MTFQADNWSVAEELVFQKLCELTGARPKQDACIGYLPPVANIWAMTGGTIADIETLWVPEVTSLRVGVKMEGQYINRPDAQRVMMNVMRLGEMKEPAPIHLFRVAPGAQFELGTEWKRLAKMETDTLLNTFVIDFELIFITVA